MLVGYARVSTLEQNLDLQIDALQKAGCDKIFTEKMSSAKERPVFQQALEFIRNDDTLIIWKLDRIGRSLIDLVHIVNGLRERGIGLQIITECFDTSTNPATTSFTPVRHSPDWIFARQNFLLRGAIHGSPCYHVLHRVVV